MGCFCTRSQTFVNSQFPLVVNPVNTSTSGTVSLVPFDGIKMHPGQFIQHYEGAFYQHYDIVRVLGEGSYGKVYLVKHQVTNQLRAVKVISKLEHQSATANLITEMKAVGKLDHPHILKLYELYVSFQSLAIVSEYLSGGELFDHLIRRGRITEQEAAQIMRQVLSAISYCHAHGVMHRDLKPENLMLERPYVEGSEVVIKVIDFGASSLFEPTQHLEKMTGTSFYIAPEVLDRSYTEKCDVWSCGVILYMLLSGFPPFRGSSVTEVLQQVRKAKVSFKFPEFRSVSSLAKSLVKKMLQKNPSQRISALDALHDEWIEQHRSQPESLETLAPHSLENLKLFHAGVRLRKAVMAFIAAQMLTSAQSSQIKAAFQAIDLDGDGRLSKEELRKAYANETSEAQAIYTVEALMQEVDSDKNGFVDYTEFLTASINAQLLLSKSNLKAAFQTFDKDSSGKISIAELRTALDSTSSLDSCVWENLILEADRNNDGEIDIEEFFRIMHGSVGDKPEA